MNKWAGDELFSQKRKREKPTAKKSDGERAVKKERRPFRGRERSELKGFLSFSIMDLWIFCGKAVVKKAINKNIYFIISVLACYDEWRSVAKP